jgi:hypothetical protein
VIIRSGQLDGSRARLLPDIALAELPAPIVAEFEPFEPIYRRLEPIMFERRPIRTPAPAIYGVNSCGAPRQRARYDRLITGRRYPFALWQEIGA